MTAASSAAPPTRARGSHAWRAWAVGVGLLVTAWGVTFASSQWVEPVAPFVTVAAVGEEVEGRNFELTINDVRAATSVTGRAAANSSLMWFSEGNWLIVDLTVAGTHDAGVLFTGNILRIGERTFRASERPVSLARTALHAGIPRTGSLAFELPPDVFEDDHARAAFGELCVVEDPRGDSGIGRPIGLASLEILDEAALADLEWGAR